MKSKATRDTPSRSPRRSFRSSKTALAAASCLAVASTAIAGDGYSRFVGVSDFSTFSTSPKDKGELIMLSPILRSPINWNQLVVSWNIGAPAGIHLGVELKAVFSDGSTTKFYSMGTWSPDHEQSSSASKQKDSDGLVATDTLMLSRPASGVQIRLTFENSPTEGPNGASGPERGSVSRSPAGGGINDQEAQFPSHAGAGGAQGKIPRPSTLDPSLKFLGLSFCNTNINPPPPQPNKAAWGKIIATPELSQNSYPQEKGWCSATSMSMVLQRWSGLLHRPEMNLDVPEVAAGVLDTRFGTGNWSFNCAFAGKFADMRAYVTRFSDISELEDWVVAGIPVIISAPFHLLQPGRHDTGSGHLVVCIGFTETGDVVINDPATNLKKGQSVRHVYKRENVIRAWATSHNTVYLVYPVSAKLPENRLGQWE